MPIIDKYRLEGKDPGILAIAFPGVRLLRGPHFPPFVPGHRLIVISDLDPFPFYADREVIQIRRDAAIALDTNEGFLKFLAKSGVKATRGQVEELLEMDDDDFWHEAKLGRVMGYFPNLPPERVKRRRGAVYRLYDKLFEDFDAVYREFYTLVEVDKKSCSSILSSLLTMVLKSQDANRRGGKSEYYYQILKKNQKNVRKFKRLLLDVIRGGMGPPLPEKRLLSFLHACSQPEENDLL